MQKLQKLLKPSSFISEYAETFNASEISNTHSRLASQYIELEFEYRRVILRMTRD